MGRDTNIANDLRTAGLRVVECDGWQTRGSSDFNPRGSVNHHTAGSSSGTCPSLNGVINGHPGSASGPLCNVLQSREPDGNDIFYVVAAGRANHAGEGGWKGLSGNSTVYGLEIEHTGVDPLPQGRQKLAARFHAALARGNYNESMVCQHREWAPNRKIDAAEQVDPNQFRAWVRDYLQGQGEDDDEMKEADFDRIVADMQRVMVDVLRKEGVSGSASKADKFSDAEKSDIQRIVTDVLRKEGVSNT